MTRTAIVTPVPGDAAYGAQAMKALSLSLTLAAVIAATATPLAWADAQSCPASAARLSPKSGSPSQLATLRVDGAQPGQPLFLHARDRRRARWHKTWRLAREVSTCARLRFRGRWLRRLPVGLWRLTVDSDRRPRKLSSPWVELSVQRKLIAPFRRYFVVLRRSVDTPAPPAAAGR
jgi:hypothetical protein